MKALVRLLATVLLLGTAIQQGWLLAGSRILAQALGMPGPAAMDGTGFLQGLAGLVRSLPDPWYTLTLMLGGVLGVLATAFIIRAAVRTAQRLTGWVRDVWV